MTTRTRRHFDVHQASFVFGSTRINRGDAKPAALTSFRACHFSDGSFSSFAPTHILHLDRSIFAGAVWRRPLHNRNILTATRLERQP
jgi:hypothetical protein